MATGYVRSTDTWGVNSIPFDKYKRAGIDQLVFSADDPHLDAALKNAAAHGVRAGIWIPAGGEGDPIAYARKIKGLQQTYGNVTIIPNIETTGKGYAGSKGWQWSQTMMNELKRLGVPPNMQVAVMGNQDDFNYKAYTSNGVHVTAEAFGAKTSDTYDPAKIRQRLIDNGVPPDMIDVILAPGHSGKGGNSVFTVDDLRDDQLQPGMYSYVGAQQVAPVGSQQTDGPRVYTNEPNGAGADQGYTQVDVNQGYSQVRDANNPRALAYARQRLAQLQKQGYSPRDFGITGDPTAQWRAMSAITGAQQAISSGHAADYRIPPGTTPEVSDYITKILTAAQTPNTAPPGDDVIRPGGAAGPVSAAPDMSNVAALVRAAAATRQSLSRSNQTSPPIPVQREIAQNTFANGSARSVAGPPLAPHQMVPLTPLAQRVGPMQQAIQVAAALRTLRQLRPANPVGRD